MLGSGVSNSERVVAATPIEDCASEVNIKGHHNTVTTTLGLQWNTTEDMFVVPAMSVLVEYPITKRNILKKISAVFDPFGLVSPNIVQAKIMLQELWTRVYDWAEEVQDQVANQIQEWFAQLKCLEKLKIPRCLRNPVSQVQTSGNLVACLTASLLSRIVSPLPVWRWD